ncbi:MAG: hypothetical protein K2J71_10085, partial [Oscillospiraceae bacterium]|nr:hypothetical protein [Oscillospiraceae bacterium]
INLTHVYPENDEIETCGLAFFLSSISSQYKEFEFEKEEELLVYFEIADLAVQFCSQKLKMSKHYFNLFLNYFFRKQVET